ncbi:MAG TPA: FecR domain-containing protein, partial [Polyangiales bacterium]|nr:FecR domain-containing protein [Polyangiales bacterium]
MTHARGFTRACLLAALLFWSCGRSACLGGGSLAELTEVHGHGVDRDFADAQLRWHTADVGARFSLGDGVRVGEKAQALLELHDGSRVKLPPGSLVRFRAVESGNEHGLDVELGEAEISVADDDLVLRTELGVAVLHAGSRVRIAYAGKQRLQLRVELGTAQLQPTGGSLRYLAAGQDVEVGIGMAVMEPAKKPTAVPPPVLDGKPPPDPANEPEVADGTGTGTETGTGTGTGEFAAAEALVPGPARTSLQAGGGESFSVHAARLPVNVALAVGARCPAEAALIAGKQRTRGQGKVSAALPAGSHAYALHCVNPDGSLSEPAIASGTISVQRDPGTAQLPARAPTAAIDADGKRYTVLYQNLLPRITLGWPNAPKSHRYVVSAESNGKSNMWSSERASYAFKAGALREGSHTLAMSTPDGARSKATTLEIRFDNAAPKASVSQPRDGSFAPGDSVDVAGVALPGFEVSLPGGSLEVDAQSRFHG